MSVTRVAYRYAKSLIELASEKGKLEVVSADMTMLNNLTKEHREFYLMLKSPIVKTDKKLKVLQQVFAGKIDGITDGFLKLLTNKKRESYVPEIAGAFVEQYNTLKGITHATLTTAIPAEQGLQNKVIEILRSQAGKLTVELETIVDPDLIGGFILRYDDKLFDDSVASRLKALEDEFKDNAYIKKFRH